MPRRLTLRLLAVPALAALSLAPLALAACGLDLTGQASADDAGPSDATVAPDARDAGGGDGAVADATDEPTDDTGTPPPPDSGKDAGKDCGATQGPAGQANAFPSPGGKVIDGDLGDWGCQAPLVLDKDTAAFVLKPDGGTVAVSAKVRWEYEAGHLFFAAEVTDLLLEADAGDSTLNDSIEMYGSSDAGPLKGTYGANDHHYVWDYKGLVQDWAKSSPVTPPTGVTSKVVITPNGYTVEASILPTAFARASFVAGDVMSVDLELNDSDGVRQNYYLVWQLSTSTPCTCNEPTCCCGGSADLPWCDTRRFGSLLFR